MPRKRSKREEKILIDRIVKELTGTRDCDRVLDVCFPEQRAFIQDPSELKAALCTRRCGKTTAAAVYLVYEALRTPGVNCVYIHQTRGEAKKTMLSGADDDAALLKVLERLGIEADINHTELSFRFRNGSVIWLTGADASPDEAKKIYGKKYQLAIIDEAGGFRNDLSNIVYQKLRPAMAQADGSSGTIALIGTPENNRNFFYRITCNDEENDQRLPGWSTHQWSYHANPYQRDAIERQLNELKQSYPGIATNPKHEFYPMFQQHYLGKWVMDRNALVYAFNHQTNFVDELPQGSFTYCSGVDFGFVDAATIVTVAYREHDTTLYVVEAYKQSHQDKSEFALEVVRRKARYGVTRFVADHDPGTIQDIHDRFGVYMEPAEKIDKVGFISIMNAEWLRGRIKIVRGTDTQPLVDELEKLVWEKRQLINGVKREDPGLDNHCCDALLYVWRALYHYLAKPEAKDELSEYDRYALLLRKQTSKRVKEQLDRKKRSGWSHHRNW